MGLLSDLHRLLGAPAKYSIEKDGVVIDFNMLGLDPKKRTVKIYFNELTRIECVDGVGGFQNEKARYYFSMKGVDASTSWLDYISGKIDRPPIVLHNKARGMAAIGGKFIALEGPKIHYFLSFATKDPSDLVNAFNDYKKQQQKRL